MDETLIELLLRCIDEYGWSWGIVRKIINRQYGCQYTLRELQQLYRHGKEQKDELRRVVPSFEIRRRIRI
jgi:hypothetical protein